MARPGCCRVFGGGGRTGGVGAEAITTNCGFLSLFQREMAAHVGVPVATSSLMQVPWVQAMLPPAAGRGDDGVGGIADRRGIWRRQECRLDTPVVGTENGVEFFRVLIRGEKQDMDVGLAAQRRA